MWAQPPTKKKSGMTCSSQVARYMPDVKPIGFEAWGPSGCHTTTVKTQCHSTTITRLAPRTKSTKGSRPSSSGGAATQVDGAADELADRLLVGAVGHQRLDAALEVGGERARRPRSSVRRRTSPASRAAPPT